MSLRILIKPAAIQAWLADRQGQPARRRGSAADLAILFDGPRESHQPLSFDELAEIMQSTHCALLVDETPGQTFHKFIERG